LWASRRFHGERTLSLVQVRSVLNELVESGLAAKKHGAGKYHTTLWWATPKGIRVVAAKRYQKQAVEKKEA